MSQDNSPPSPSSPSSSPTRPAASTGGRPTRHRYAPSNPSSLRESHRPPPTPTSPLRALEQDRWQGYFSGQDGRDFAPDSLLNSSEESSARPEDLLRRRPADSRWNRAGSYDGYSGATTPLLEAPPTPGWPFAYQATSLQGDASPKDSAGATPGLFGDEIQARTAQKMAKMHGVRHRWLMYVLEALQETLKDLLTSDAGICTIMFPSSTGFSNTSGPSYSEISLRHSPWLLFTYPCRSPMLPT